MKNGVFEELVERTLDEDALRRVVSGEEPAGADMGRGARVSYDATREFMENEGRKRLKSASDGGGYIDFRERPDGAPSRRNVGPQGKR